MAEDLRNKINPEDMITLNANVTELSSLHRDVEERLKRLIDDLCVDSVEDMDIDAEKVKPTGREVIVTIHKARKLEKKGLFGKADPYVLLSLRGQKYKSETVNDSENPEWQFKSKMSLDTDKTNNKLDVEVFDSDIGADDALGRVTIDLAQGDLTSTWCLSKVVSQGQSSYLSPQKRSRRSKMRRRRRRRDGSRTGGCRWTPWTLWLSALQI